MASILLWLPGCQREVVRTETIEVPKLVYKPLDPTGKLTAQEPTPVRPPNNCVVAGVPTLCNKELGDWLLQYDAALTRINARMFEIDKLQPKDAK